MTGPVIVAGSDGLAVRLAQELIAVGEDVVVVAGDLEPRFRRHLEQDGVRVIEGDPRDVADLQLAGLDTAAGLAIVEDRTSATSTRRSPPGVPVPMCRWWCGCSTTTSPRAWRRCSRTRKFSPHPRSQRRRSSPRRCGHRSGWSWATAPSTFARSASTTTSRAPCPVAAFDEDAGTATLFPPAGPGVLALVADDGAQDDEATVVEVAVGELRQAASLAASLLARSAALGRLFDRRLLALLTLVAVVVAAAAVIWSTSTRYDLLDSAYFTVTTVSTTGYGDITPLHESEALKIGVMALILVGALSLALVYALIGQRVIEAIHVSRSVSSLAAPTFAAALSGRRAIATIPVGSQAVTVAELPSPIGRTVAELERAAAGEARVIALGRRWAPGADDRIGGGDVVVAIGSPSGLAALAGA